MKTAKLMIGFIETALHLKASNIWFRVAQQNKPKWQYGEWRSFRSNDQIIQNNKETFSLNGNILFLMVAARIK